MNGWAISAVIIAVVAAMILVARWLGKRACARGNHAMRTFERESFQWPSKCWSGVADSVTESRSACSRCGAGGDWEETDRHSIQSLSMGSKRWRELERTGRIEA